MLTEPRATRIYTPARIVALVLIALVTLGLTYIRFAPDDGSVSVPAGAKAGDLILEPCTYGTEKGTYAADCGTLVVPENRADPQSRLIALPVTRIRARSEQPAEPIFVLQGGPGITNMEFEKASRFTDDHDVVLVGYRGADGSVRLHCPEVNSALKHSRDFLAEKSFRAHGDAYRDCADRLTADGVDLARYGLVQQVDDFEAARVALGYERINLLSESAGTRTAMIYAWRYPESLHRSVMIGVNPPGNFLWHPRATDEQIGRYADLCSKDAACSTRTDDLAASMRKTAADFPERWFFLPIKEGNVRVVSFFGLMESTSEAFPIAGPMIVDSWLSAAEGDASSFWFASVFGDVLFPELFVWGQYAAAASLDAEAARDYFSSGGQGRASSLANVTALGWGGGRMADGWPPAADEDKYSRVRTSEVETLLIGGALDFATPPQIATRELLPYLPNGHEVVLPGVGHTGSFFAVQPKASSHLINNFFDTGGVDDSLYEPESVDFTPAMTLTALAKIVAGALGGLALLTVLSLLWMARRVQNRGQFGGKAGAVLRSVYPLVLGLGGWFLAVLIVLTTMPGVPIDHELVAVLSTGVPIGLGIYWAWVHRDWAARSKGAGFAAAAAGALAGAWLGFHAALGLMGLLTAIAGAVAGANLMLILLDISREQRDMKTSNRVLVRWAILVIAVLLTFGACASGGDTYEEFSSALDNGASCRELFSQRENFDRARVLERIDADLERIGCTSRDAERNDR
jgi:pimeloyl-ACP methyl ester carboxylesterase